MKMNEASNKLKPVQLDVKKAIAKAMQRPGFKTAWKSLDSEYTSLAKRLNARKRSV